MAFTFGQPSASTSTTTPGFGGTSFSFGNTNTNQPAANTPAPAPTTGLFGQPAAQPAAQPTTSLFGAANTNTTTTTGTTGTGTTTGGLFGSTTTSATGGGLFGSTTTQPQNQTATQPTGGLFGSTAPATGGSLFGNTTTNTTTQPSTGLFSSTTTQPAAGGGLFGAKPAGTTTSLFGQPPSTTGTTTGFGQTTTQPNPLAQSTLTASTLGPAPQAPKPNNLQVSVFGTPGSAGLSLEQRIENIAQAWNPGSPSCRFQYYFYNLVDNPQSYGRPANATNEALWKRAVSENPNPDRLVPALALGFDDLKKRVTSQKSQSNAHIAALAALRTRLADLNQKHAESHTTRLARAAQQHTELARRVRMLAQRLHMLIPSVRRSALSPEEDELRRKLGSLEEGAGMARMSARMNELWAAVGGVQAMRERARREGAGSAVEWAVVDEEGLANIAQILKDQQNGLSHVTRILQDDVRALKIMQEGGPAGHDSQMYS
ncbi:nucleoporin nup44 [Ceratobasidium sp. AG-Ba]|nr:nucleoporin nup44 [Ceratobasidium sp. AG-Ba]